MLGAFDSGLGDKDHEHERKSPRSHVGCHTARIDTHGLRAVS